MLGPTCEPDCPACAAESDARHKLIDGVREIVLGMWLESVAAGERDVEGALRELSGPLAKLSYWDRSRIGWDFTAKALATKVHKTRRRKPRGLPTAWKKANRELVDLVHRETMLPKTSPYALSRKRVVRTAFDQTAALWQLYGIRVQNYDVAAAYFDRRKPKRACKK